MKTKNKPHFLLMAIMVAVFAAITWSCNKDDDPSLADLREDKLAYLTDSLRISDSLRLTNNAGVVNYAVTVVDGSTSSIYANNIGGRSSETQSAVSGAIVTISQYGKTLSDTTDASGIVVFNGFFRSAVNITVEKTDFTKVSYISAVNIQDSTRTGTISFVGNLIPLFPTTGANTATISGRATIQTNLTNKTRETVPDGTTISAAIDATNSSQFSDKFLTSNIDDKIFISACGCQFIYIGNILQASYSTGVIASVSGGNYTITVPAAIDGLPLVLEYSDVAADQTLYETAGIIPGDRTATYRTVFVPGTILSVLSAIPAGSGVSVSFESVTTSASATAVISANAGTLDRINVTNGGSGYIAATPPIVEIVGGGGTGATATATVSANGRVTDINLTSPGTGYTSTPSVLIISGSGATASGGLQANGTVVSTAITNSGSGYTAAPAITFSAPPAPGTTATGTANIDALGRVTSITITSPGTGYTANPSVTIAAAPAGGVSATANAFYSGQSVNEVTVTGGSNYTYAPTVTFSAPQRSNGVTATGTASIDPITRTVTGIQITNAGSGYTSPPTVTLQAGSGATAQVFLTGGSVISANIIGQGSGYAYAPRVTFTGGGGEGAAATAVIADGKIVGLDITNGGTGYTGAPTINFVTGDQATAYATVTNGVITGITVSDGGRNFNGAPRVVLSSSVGGGATATATVANGAITGVTVNAGGSGYLEGNTPGSPEVFTATKPTDIETKPGLKYINDIHYGTGVRQPN